MVKDLSEISDCARCVINLAEFGFTLRKTLPSSIKQILIDYRITLILPKIPIGWSCVLQVDQHRQLLIKRIDPRLTEGIPDSVQSQHCEASCWIFEGNEETQMTLLMMPQCA